MLTILLALIERLIGEVDPTEHLAKCRNVLIVDTAFIGDMVRSTPVYRAVKEHIPGAGVDAMIFEAGRPVFRHNPHVDDLRVIPQKSLVGQISAALRLRRNRYDVTINLFTGLRMNFLCLLIGAPLRVGYNYRHRACFNNRRVPIQTRTVQTIFRPEECLILLERAFGWKIGQRDMIFTVFEQDCSSVDSLLEKLNCRRGESLVGFHTNSISRREEKRWDERKFAALADGLITRHGVKVVFTGIDADRPTIDSIISMVRNRDRVVSTAGMCTLAELGALIQRCSLFVTLDTGPLHISVALGTPTFALVGGVPLELVIPPGKPRFRGIAAGYSASAPLQTLRELSVEDVSAEIERMQKDLRLFDSRARTSGPGND